MPATIMLVEDDEAQRQMFTLLLTKQKFVVLAVENGVTALEELKQSRPDLILLDVMMPDMDGFSVCRQIRATPRISRIPVIMLTALTSIENKVKGFEAGADDYIPKPADPTELVSRINAQLKRSEKARLQASSREPAQTIAVFSLRGGSGVSTVSVNLAAGLAALWGKQVALVDMVSYIGQSALFLNQTLHNSWAELCKMRVEEIDEDMVLRAMLPHESGVYTLASPPRPEQSELLSPEKTGHVLNILHEYFPYMVLDMPHDLTERSLVALDRSDIILVLAQPEIASLRAASVALETFKALLYEDKQVHVILNNTFPRNGLVLKDIDRLLGSKVDLTLPYAAEDFVAAINHGEPPVLENPRGPLGIFFEDLALAVSKESHRASQPDFPTPAWKRATDRSRRRK